MSSMFCKKIYQCRNADWCARDFNPKSDSPECFEPKTHYDEIKAMSVEELAKLFVSGWYDGPLFTCPVEDVECESNVSCDVCFLEWLKSPVEVDE